jgi:DNA-binding response OmpR family regulator
LVGVLPLLARAKGGAIRRRIGALEIDELARTATVAGRRLELRIEFELLRHLAAEPRSRTPSGSCCGTSGASMPWGPRDT